jgi:hypothetical protein
MRPENLIFKECILYTFIYYPSQHNNYQNLIHVACVKWVLFVVQVSAHRAIIRQYTLIISQATELRSIITIISNTLECQWAYKKIYVEVCSSKAYFCQAIPGDIGNTVIRWNLSEYLCNRPLYFSIWIGLVSYPQSMYVCIYVYIASHLL